MSEAWLKVEFLKDGVNARILEDVRVPVGDFKTMVLPLGTVTDFASFPRLLWRVWPPSRGKYIRAAAVHDWLCGKNGVSVAKKDRIMFEIMRADGVSAFSRWCIYLGLRAGWYLCVRNPWGGKGWRLPWQS